MDLLMTYLQSPDFQDFLRRVGIPLILATILLSFVSLLLEVRLPLKYYWDLPGHALQSLLQGLKIMRPAPTWGICRAMDTKKPLPLVACELLDEVTRRPVMRTYSNHLGQFGFPLRPGRYLLRAVKTHYQVPSWLDPENIEIRQVDESFVISVIILNSTVVPQVDVPLVPVKKVSELTSGQAFWHYVRTFVFQLGNVFLILDVVVALAGFVATRDAFFGVILAVAVALLFIKLYILETISVVTEVHHA
jgi:hypothetical protein